MCQPAHSTPLWSPPVGGPVEAVFAVDVLRCPGCGGRRKIVAAITQVAVGRAILAALSLPTEPPAVHPARGPPGLFEGESP